MAKIAEMTVGQIVGGGVGLFAILSIFVEFAPVKINPVSAFLNWIGERTNKGLTVRVEELEKKVDGIVKDQKDLSEEMAEHEAINCRIRILRFSDELRRNIKHSQESFDQVISDLDNYEIYCSQHAAFKNNKTMAAKQRIMSAYNSCMEQDDFL